MVLQHLLPGPATDLPASWFPHPAWPSSPAMSSQTSMTGRYQWSAEAGDVWPRRGGWGQRRRSGELISCFLPESAVLVQFVTVTKGQPNKSSNGFHCLRYHCFSIPFAFAFPYLNQTACILFFKMAEVDNYLGNTI